MANHTSAKRILIISDAWHPQINGVVRTLEATIAMLEQRGYAVHLIAPGKDSALVIPLPFYPEIKLELFGSRRIAKALREFKPDIIHIATEGTLGAAARRICLAENLRFTTAYHTCFPEYVAARVNKIRLLRGWGGGVAQFLAYRFLRRFHNAASAVMVPTEAVAALLNANKVAADRLQIWSRGVSTTVFQPGAKNHPEYEGLTRPIAIFVGRIAVEKNIAAFLAAPFAGSKVIVGDGPLLPALRAQYPQARYVGAVAKPEEVAAYYRAADVFVFPSMTDTFGLVLLEAMASGLPVAACPGPGQNSIFARAQRHDFYCIDSDISLALQKVMLNMVTSEIPRSFVQQNYSWEACTQEFIRAMMASLAPLERHWFRQLIYDLLIGWPLALVQRIPGLPLMQWSGKYLLRGALDWRSHHQNKPRLDDFE
ncbi:MAG: glycosyltransferase [Alphaproteobacteria bacterium]|nr:glycosyltransferase [Alphaproteobacteria bacterium]